MCKRTKQIPLPAECLLSTHRLKLVWPDHSLDSPYKNGKTAITNAVGKMDDLLGAFSSLGDLYAIDRIYPVNFKVRWRVQFCLGEEEGDQNWLYVEMLCVVMLFIKAFI